MRQASDVATFYQHLRFDRLPRAVFRDGRVAERNQPLLLQKVLDYRCNEDPDETNELSVVVTCLCIVIRSFSFRECILFIFLLKM